MKRNSFCLLLILGALASVLVFVGCDTPSSGSKSGRVGDLPHIRLTADHNPPQVGDVVKAVPENYAFSAANPPLFIMLGVYSPLHHYASAVNVTPNYAEYQIQSSDIGYVISVVENASGLGKVSADALDPVVAANP